MIENSVVYKITKWKHSFLPIGRAEGAKIWDRDGKEYIDFTSGWNVTNLGWNHPEVNEAVIDQAKKNVQSLLWGSDISQEEYAKALTAVLPKELDACVKETGGTESVEVAVKIARVYTGRKKIIGFNNTYHGQLFASLALGAPESSRPKLSPLVPEISHIDFPREELGKEGFEKFLTEFESMLSGRDVAGVVTEPGIITGGGTTYVGYPGLLTKMRELTEKYGTLLIVDEVGTGFSRTGKLFGIEHEGVVPDMLVLAKGISNGASAIGTVVGKTAVFEPAFTDAVLVSTFGWTPVGCASALKTLQVHIRDKTWEMAEQKGKYAKEKLSVLIGEKVVAVRGLGLEIGLEFANPETAQAVRKKAFESGLHVVLGNPTSMQLMPPLTIPQDLLEKGLNILIKCVKEE